MRSATEKVNHQRREKPLTGARLLLADLEALHEPNKMQILSFVFWRWFTLANVIELLLVMGLTSACVYQCGSFLNDYYNYPSQIIVKKILNDDFRTDLPAVTVCDNNIVSKATLAKHHPELNETHYLAISLGTFYSVDNFTIDEQDRREGEQLAKKMESIRILFETNWQTDRVGLDYAALGETPLNQRLLDMNSPQGTNNQTSMSLASQIDWVRVAMFLSNMTINGTSQHLPEQDIVEQVDCANIWGDNLPCKNLKRIKSIQNNMACVTLFHDSIFWDDRNPGVGELDNHVVLYKSGVAARSASMQVARGGAATPWSTSETNAQISITSDVNEGILLKLSETQVQAINESLGLKENFVEMGTMEMLRLRLNFRKDDYADKRITIGAHISIHSNNFIGLINHVSYFVEPERWYSYYIERLDFKRLRSPYTDNCYDFEQNRLVWWDRIKWREENLASIWDSIHRQGRSPDALLNEYRDNHRRLSMGNVSSLEMNRAADEMR